VSHQVQITFDAADPARLSTFWCQVLGADPEGNEFCLD
jgi:hypothetical protein